jgi:hypothetical protein
MPAGQRLPPVLASRDAAGFWLAVVLTGAGTGLAAAALTGLLEAVQQPYGVATDWICCRRHPMPTHGATSPPWSGRG